MIDEQLALYLQSKGLGTFDPTGVTGDMFIGLLPETPDGALAIFPTGGFQADSKLGYSMPTLQIVVRGTMDPRPAQQRAQAVYDALHGVRNRSFTDGGTWVVSCLGMQSAPTHIGRDDNGRHEYSLNFRLELKP